jgi:hypothetical protein
MTDRVFTISSHYYKTEDPVAYFGVDAVFRNYDTCYTQMGMAVCGRDRRRVKQLIAIDPDAVSRVCCTQNENHVAYPLELCSPMACDYSSELWTVTEMGYLLLLHGAEPTMRLLSGQDIEDECYTKVKTFRAKLCAIFWVTQQTVWFRDMSEPLLERVLMSTLDDDPPLPEVTVRRVRRKVN